MRARAWRTTVAPHNTQRLRPASSRSHRLQRVRSCERSQAVRWHHSQEEREIGVGRHGRRMAQQPPAGSHPRPRGSCGDESRTCGCSLRPRSRTTILAAARRVRYCHGGAWFAVHALPVTSTFPPAMRRTTGTAARCSSASASATSPLLTTPCEWGGCGRRWRRELPLSTSAATHLCHRRQLLHQRSDGGSSPGPLYSKDAAQVPLQG